MIPEGWVQDNSRFVNEYEVTKSAAVTGALRPSQETEPTLDTRDYMILLYTRVLRG